MNHNSLIRHEQTLDPVMTHDVLTDLDVPKQPTVRREYPTDKQNAVSLSEWLFLSVMLLLVITTINNRMLASGNA